jgi:carbohydrate diacid regulator
MRKRKVDKVLKIQSQLEDYLKKDVPSIFAITGKLGVQVGEKKWYWEKAKKAAETRKYQKEGRDIFWIPLVWQGEVAAVCGVQGFTEYPKEQAKLLEGLIEKIAYEQFIEEQVNKMIDPRSMFVKELLETDKIKTFEQAIDKGDILGINLRAPQAVIIIRTPGLFKRYHEKYQGLSDESLAVKITEDSQKMMHQLSTAFQNYEKNIFACIAPDLFISLKWVRGQVNTLNTIKFFKNKAEFLRKTIKEELQIDATVGVGQYYPGLSGLRKSFNDAKVALHLGEKIWGGGKTYHIVDVGMLVALSKEINFERKCELAFQIMKDIFADDSLFKTVNVFLENDMNLTEAAKKLHLHRNTLIYRLDKIKKSIGLDPRKFSDAIQIKLGLILYSLKIRCESK